MAKKNSVMLEMYESLRYSDDLSSSLTRLRDTRGEAREGHENANYIMDYDFAVSKTIPDLYDEDIDGYVSSCLIIGSVLMGDYDV